jgi:hypothetical protein
VTLAGKLEQMVAALAPLAIEIPELQVCGFWNPNPTPPSIDIYPGDPFQQGAGFGITEKEVFFTVRARVSTADDEAGQGALRRMMDPADPASVEAALADGDVAVIGNDGSVSGYRQYSDGADPGGATLLGCEWRVEAFL